MDPFPHDHGLQADDVPDSRLVSLRQASPPPVSAAAHPLLPTMRTMTEAEVDAFVSTGGFGILALAEGNRAYGVPLFYGAREGAIYFQTRGGMKTHYLYATTEACLTISSARGMGEWASVQLLGRLERVDAFSSSSLAHGAIVGIPPPLLWASEDSRAEDAQAGGVSTFRLVPTRRIGRYSQPARQAASERNIGF